MPALESSASTSQRPGPKPLKNCGLVSGSRGSAAKNLHAIISGLLASECPIDRFLFCTDDKHLEDIHQDGHIRFNIKQAIDLGLSDQGDQDGHH